MGVGGRGIGGVLFGFGFVWLNWLREGMGREGKGGMA